MGTSANCEDPDEMPHSVAFHQGQHCLLTKLTFGEIQYFWEIINYDPLTPSLLYISACYILGENKAILML